MKRRHLLVSAGAAATLTACSADPPAATTEFRWKLVTAWQANFPGLAAGAKQLADAIGRASGGRLTIETFAGNELIAPFEVFDAVSRGSVEMGHSAAYFWKNKHPAMPFFCTVPFGLNAQEMNAWLYHGGGLELWRELYAGFNLVPFPAGNTGVQMAGWFNREITSVDDLKGLKMRIPGLGGEVMTRLGSQAVNLPGVEIAAAMRAGIIDACEWMNPWNDLAFGLFDVAKYCYAPGWQEPGQTIECMINRDAYAALPQDLQAIVEQCCRAINADLLAEYTAENQRAMRTLIDEHQVEFRRLPDSVLSALRNASESVLTDLAGDNGFARRVLASYRGFRDQSRAWHALSELPYYQARE
ncbi:MAG: TRAP transporter substrate-binding protein DctP [Pseudomonadota bacterium]|nr:TRAP transporter substrate-binding protein DctP [Pseudomonadota bacterium]